MRDPVLGDVWSLSGGAAVWSAGFAFVDRLLGEATSGETLGETLLTFARFSAC